MNETYTIPEFRVPGLQEQLAKLTKKATKLGVAPITLQLTGKFEDRLLKRPDNGENVTIRFVEVEVTGETPKIAGWSFGASLEETEGGTVIKKSPDCKVDLAQFANTRHHCQHCNAIRNRRSSYVLVHENGEFKQVGSTCISDFLGGVDPHMLARHSDYAFAFNDLLSMAEEEGSTGGGGFSDRHLRANLVEFLAYTSLYLGTYCYVSRARSRESMETSTASLVNDRVIRHPSSMSQKDRSMWKGLGDITEANTAEAEAAIEHAITTITPKVEAGTANDFEMNLLTVARCTTITMAISGIATYLVPHYRRSLEDQAKVKAGSEYPATSQYGEKGKRYKNIEVVYRSSSGWDSDFGYTYLHRFWVDGNLLVWKTGTEVDADENSKVLLTFTVKDHTDYKGTLQTAITRCVVSVPAENPF